MEICPRSVTSIIGPSGCGKSTFLRSVNRMNDLVPGTSASGVLEVNGQDVYDKRINLVNLRQQVGMVFQRPNPFPKSIFDNVAYGPRIQGIRRAARLEETVQRCLVHAALWEGGEGRPAKERPGAVRRAAAEAPHSPGTGDGPKVHVSKQR